MMETQAIVSTKNNHKFLVEYTSEKIICSICGKTYVGEVPSKSFAYHLATMHQIDVFNYFKINNFTVVGEYIPENTKVFINADTKEVEFRRVFKQDKNIVCQICNKAVSRDYSLKSHLKRIHKIENYIDEYFLKFYKNLTEKFKYETCGFCQEIAIPETKLDHINKTISLFYTKGYDCETRECKDQRSLLYFGEISKSKMEHIGANVDYLAKKHKTSIDEAKKLKIISAESVINKNNRHTKIKYTEEQIESIVRNKKEEYAKKGKSDLAGFIERHGEELGREKYLQRCKKIGYSLTYGWFKDKYGEELGKIKYEERLNKKDRSNFFKGQTSSLNDHLEKMLKDLHITNYQKEYHIFSETKNYFVDFYLPEYNMILEAYGVFWHTKPTFYLENYYHKFVHLTAKQIWEKDRNRILGIREILNQQITVLILWEDSLKTFIDLEYLKNLLETFRSAYTTIEV